MTLKQMRINAGLTQDELAVKAGLSVSMVRSMENGRRTGSITTVRKLSSILDTTLDAISIALDTTKSTIENDTQGGDDHAA